MSSRLSSLLVQDGVVSAAKMADALQRQVIQGGALDSNLLETKAIDEDALAPYLGKAASLPMQPTGIAAMGQPLPEVLAVFTTEVAQRFRAVPTTLRSGGVLQVLVTVDSTIADIDSLALVIRQRIEPWAVFEFRLHEALDKVYGLALSTRFARLVQRSAKAHEGKSYPAARLIDPIPRFGSLAEVRLAGPPPSEATAALLVSEATAAALVAPVATPAASPAAPALEKTEALPVPLDVVQAALANEKTEAVPVPAEPAPVLAPAAVVPPATSAAAPSVVVEPVPVAVVAPVAPAIVAAPTPVSDAKPAVAEPAPVAPPAVVAPAAAVVVAEPAPAKAAAPAAAPAVVEETPRSSRSAPSYSGIDQLSMDEWESVSAADWLSVANKIEPVEAAASSAPLPELPPVPAVAPVSKPVVASPVPTPVAAAASGPVARPVAAASPTAAPQTPARPAQAASAVSPNEASRRNKKRNKGQPQTPAQATQQKPAAPAVVSTTPPAAAVPAAAKDAARPAAPATQKSLPAVVAKPAAAAPAAASAKPAAAAPPAQPAKPSTVSRPAIAVVGKPAPASTVSGKLAAPAAAAADKSGPVAISKPAAPAVAVVREKSQPTVAAVPAAVVAQKAPAAEKPVAAKPAAAPVSAEPVAAVVVAPVPAVAAVPEAIPEVINSGRLGEPLPAVASSAPALSEPPPSSESPDAAESDEVPGPAPRIALALDESSGATLSLEAARELVAVAADRDAIFEALCRGARSRARFACVFTIHGEVAFGRVALEDSWLDRQHVGRVSVPLDRASVFRQAAKARQQHVGTLGDPAVTNDPLRALGRRPPLPGAVLPILLRGRPVALLYLDDDGRELSDTLATELAPLLSEVGQAFQRLVQQSKSGGLGGVAEFDEAASPQEVADPGTSAWRPRPQPTPAPEAVATPAVAPSAAEKPAVEKPAVEKPAVEKPAVEKPVAAAPPAAAVPVPVPASEQPTVPLRVDRNKQAAAAGKSAPAPVVEKPSKVENAPAPAAAVAQTAEKPEEATENLVKLDKSEVAPKATGKAGRGSHKSPPSSTVSPASAKDGGKDSRKDSRDQKDSKDQKEPKTGGEDWAAWVERAAGGEDAAVAALLAGGDAAVAAVVAALPGPLRSQERAGLGDPQSAEANLMHSPLLLLTLRLGLRAVAPLVARLQEKETAPRVRYFLVRCLGEMPVAAALDPLFERLYDADDEVRAAAAAALRNFPPSQALNGLRAKLREQLDDRDSSDVKRLVSTVDALGELRDTVVGSHVIDLLDHSDPLVVDAAGRALQAITKQDFGRSRYRWSGWWRRHQAEPRLQWLLAGLCHGSAMIRSSAQDELVEMSGDVSGYRFDLPTRERESAAKQWAEWWQRHGYDVV